MKKKYLRIKKLMLTKRESIRAAELVLNHLPRNNRLIKAKAGYQEIMNRVGSEHVTPVGGNVFLDLGFSPELALH